MQTKIVGITVIGRSASPKYAGLLAWRKNRTSAHPKAQMLSPTNDRQAFHDGSSLSRTEPPPPDRSATLAAPRIQVAPGTHWPQPMPPKGPQSKSQCPSRVFAAYKVACREKIQSLPTQTTRDLTRQ